MFTNILAKVDFPIPETPDTPNISFSFSKKDILDNTCLSPYCLQIFSTLSILVLSCIKSIIR